MPWFFLVSSLLISKLNLTQDVVLVTINYRLGMLGYLSTGDDVIGGNFGALDQITALHWVQKYIRGFGGNPGFLSCFYPGLFLFFQTDNC